MDRLKNSLEAINEAITNNSRSRKALILRWTRTKRSAATWEPTTSTRRRMCYSTSEWTKDKEN